MIWFACLVAGLALIAWGVAAVVSWATGFEDPEAEGY